MKILELYLWKVLIISIVLTWVSLVGLDSFFNYLRELKDTNADDQYGTLQALIYMAYRLPQSFYEFFPTATLIGAVMGLGQLAASSELVAMRAAGVSIRSIIFGTLKLGLLMAMLIFALGEWVTPLAEIQGKNFKLEKQEKNYAFSKAGSWFKEDDKKIHIDKTWNQDKFLGVSLYEYNQDRLKSITRAETAERKGDYWLLQDVMVRTFKPSAGIEVQHYDQLKVDRLVPSDILMLAATEAKHLSTQELSTFIKHQDQNDLSTTRLKQAYWKRFSIPLSILVMLIIAIPFTFGSQRSAGAGQRLFFGILIGITFFLFNRAASSIGVVYGFSPILSSFMPLIFFLGIGLFFLRRIR
jgi:lipopolysaccharide export system permease protein